MALKSVPLRRYRDPSYPTKLDVIRCPELLRKHLPSRWLRRAELAGAAAAFLTLNTGCSGEKNPAPGASSTQPGVGPAIVAPLFEHGDGRGATGCIVVSPPNFLSEEDALQIVREELSRLGLEFTESETVLPGVQIPGRIERFKKNWVTGKRAKELSELPRTARPLAVDLRDAKRRIAVEYVSLTDYSQLGGVWSASSVQSYDMKEVASYVAGQVRKQGSGVYFGVLYDPIAKPESSSTDGDPKDFMKRLNEEAKRAKRSATENRRLLRQQVREFADWLKAQGAL